jgi:capsular exopolysaccharide synthesis family protein
LEVTVIDSNPERAALIGNSLIEVFIDYNEALQTSRFALSEGSLQKQIAQVEGQINSLQTEMMQISEQSEETQKIEQEVATLERLDELKQQMDVTEEEIIKLEQQLIRFTPTPMPATSTPENRWSATATPAPTPTTSPEKLAQFLDLQQQLDRWTTLRNLYKQTYATLLVSGDRQVNNPTDDTIRQNQLQTALALYQQIYTNLLNNYETIRLARLRSTPNVVQIEPATIPLYPIQPRPVRDSLLGAISGVLLMGVIAFMIEYMDDTLKTPEDIHRHLQVPVIGLIGEMHKPKGRKKDEHFEVYVAENPLSPITESFRTLRTNLEFASVDNPIKTLLVTSTQPAEGKTTLAVNLSVIMAQGEKRVVLIDTDLRRPSVHRYLGIANRIGLSDIFRSQAKLANIIVPWGDPQIAAITSGGLPPNPTELLNSDRMNKILDELKEMVDIVILDAPPGIVADPIVMAAKVDGVILVVEPGKTKIDAAQVLMEQLNRADARVVGAVLNPIARRRAHYYSKYRYQASYYYYTRGYGHYFSNNGGSQSKRGKKRKKEDQPEVPTPAD